MLLFRHAYVITFFKYLYKWSSIFSLCFVWALSWLSFLL